MVSAKVGNDAMGIAVINLALLPQPVELQLPIKVLTTKGHAYFFRSAADPPTLLNLGCSFLT